MLKIAILDANEIAVKDEAFIDAVNSVVGNWLAWELEQAEVNVVSASACDVLFLVHSGQIDWLRACRSALKRINIPYSQSMRKKTPYIITGGAIDAMPYTWSQVADACAIGEAYLFIRQIIDLVKQNATIADIDAFVTDCPHALTSKQVIDTPRNPQMPWRLLDPRVALASPDDYVDWDANPLIRSADKVLRVVASKGCHLKCKFCATTYRQTYRVNPNSDYIMKAVAQATNTKDRLTLITNDVAGLPYFSEIRKHGALDSQSLTVKAIRDDETFNALLRSRIKIVRFGVEGISERIRYAFGKPIPDDELIERLGILHDAGINTHMFYIVGSPYEDKQDWDAFKVFYARLAKRIQKGICRIKLTAFEPNAPTPLGYFVTGAEYYTHMLGFTQWVADNWASRHLFVIKGRKPDTRLQDLADLYGIDKKAASAIVPSRGTLNLAPTPEDAEYMTWELVDWYLSPSKRWKLAHSYMKWMGVEQP